MPVATQILSPALASRLAAFDSAALGPHAAALLSELRQAASGGMPLAVTVLAATLVDVVANEEAGPAGFIDGIDFAYAGNKAALGWLRGRRNALLHHEGPTDGLMGEAIAADWHRRDAERAVAALLDYLDDLTR
ncbi:MAG: hypothetical protein VX401_07750 [Pseudomonadota bacterium]|nr:hypothetical protein [Pseudomonadota bacterium]MEC8269291.1 hypothetical protein [Pseudomonadota bacterium]MEC8549267.1 hypothetical protein [Pseudomonadota bacterium]MEC9145920.1 hypothetical protein [Pseudomonadota bacterium]MEE3025223.1 hypothetical protein [Pseudomonadota bacterium]